MKKLNNRGVSMMECIIAMAIIIAVSAAAASMILHFSGASAKMMIRNKAVTMASSTLECFKFAEDYYEFNRTLPLIQDAEYERRSYEETKNDEDAYVYQYAYYTMNTYGYSIALRVRYDYMNGLAHIDMTVTDEDHKDIYTLENYVKAVSGL